MTEVDFVRFSCFVVVDDVQMFKDSMPLLYMETTSNTF